MKVAWIRTERQTDRQTDKMRWLALWLIACSLGILASSFDFPTAAVRLSCLHSTALFAKRRTKVNFGRQREKPSTYTGDQSSPSPQTASSGTPTSSIDPIQLARKVALADARKNYMKANNMNEEQMKTKERQVLKEVTKIGQSDLMGEIESDVESFKRQEKNVDNAGSIANADGAGNVEGFSFGDIIAKVLVADLFLVLVFLVWFIVAAVTQQQGNPYLLERFQDIFEPVVQPALGVLMIGSIASGAADKNKEGDSIRM